MNYHPALLAGAFNGDGLEYTAAVVSAVSRVDVDVERMKAVRAVVAVASTLEGRHTSATDNAGERLVGATTGEQFHGCQDTVGGAWNCSSPTTLAA